MRYRFEEKSLFQTPCLSTKKDHKIILINSNEKLKYDHKRMCLPFNWDFDTQKF